MTSFSISHFHAYSGPVSGLDADDPRLTDWPVVYVLNNSKQVYVGESLNVLGRFVQHRQSAEKKHLGTAHVIVDSTFNKSAALDLESSLMRLFDGDGQMKLLNRNVGIVNADYYRRGEYRRLFEKIFEEFRTLGLFTKPIRDIENSNLFKLSPFKALNADQEATVEKIVLDLIESLNAGGSSQSVVQGDPGTGKTVVGIFLLKLIADLGSEVEPEDLEEDSYFSEPQIATNRETLRGLKLGFVVPQQALRKSIKEVFKNTPGLHPKMVLTPFQVGKSKQKFDLLVVDETHRLGRRANQSSGFLNKAYREINETLFGEGESLHSQLDWIVRQSDHQVLLLDSGQGVRPSDLPLTTLEGIGKAARAGRHFYPLKTQMRVESGSEYVDFIRALLSDDLPVPRDFEDYDLRLFENLAEMERVLDEKEAEFGLARMLAGYAWEWKSKKNPDAFDIEIDGVSRKWNVEETDWVQSAGAPREVGSIHTVQGYDLNYAGVIIGKDLRFDSERGRMYFDASNYADKKGMQGSETFGFEATEADLLRFVVNIYVVLLTRGIRGTYLYICDDALRERVRRVISSGKPIKR